MRKSMTAGILVLFAGYTIVSYGYVLLKGWDIPFRNWIDPLHAYVFQGTPGQIPPGQVFPSQATLTSFATVAPPSSGKSAGTAQAPGTTTAGGRGG